MNSPDIRVESHRVGFELSRGRILMLPPSYGTFRDPSGNILPKCDVFFGPWKKTRERADMNASHKRYFGASHRATLAILPKIPMTGWKRIGEVTQIFYVRRGTRAPGGYHHEYKRRGWIWKNGRKPILSKNGRLYKLSLGEGCVVDDRGYVFP
jgi:hypothetical protein